MKKSTIRILTDPNFTLQKEIKKSNAERAELLANDKKLIQEFIESFSFIYNSILPQNEEMNVVLQGIISVFEETKKELLINLKNY
jgi:hypothetical protein